MFPETEEEKEADKLTMVFGLVDLKVNKKTAWLIMETAKARIRLGGNFSVNDALDIKNRCNKIFIDE